MENIVKDRMIYFINKTIRKFNSGDFNIITNEGRIVGIRGSYVTIKMNDGIYVFMELNECKISTLIQIVEGLKCELHYVEIEKEIKKKTDYFDKEKRIWTYKPINKDLLIERIKLKLRNRNLSKNVVRLSNTNMKKD